MVDIANVNDKLERLAQLASSIQCTVYHMTPERGGCCPRGHMGRAGWMGDHASTENEIANKLLSEINSLLAETEKDLAIIKTQGGAVMICPYNRKSQKELLQCTYDYDDDGHNTNLQQLVSVDFTMQECPKEGCAVWCDGKCHYAAVSFNNE